MLVTSLEPKSNTYDFVVDKNSNETIIRRKKNISGSTIDPTSLFSPITITYTVPEISFNAFGCWNSMGNNTLISAESSDFKDSKSLPILSDMIRKFQPHLKPTFSVILGDNYYNENEENVKINVDAGFKLLAKGDIPHFIIFGNHDVRTRQALLYEVKKTYDDVVANSTGTVTFGKWILPGSNYILKVKSQYTECNFVMIDTNLFCETKKYFGLPNDRSGLLKLQEMVISWIDRSLSTLGKLGPVFVAGHHPFFAFGHKVKKPIIHNSELDPIYNLLIKHNVKFYLCADEHNFQYVYDSNNDIHHIITGGSSSGDESFTFGYSEKPYDSRGIKLNIPGTNLHGKMIINSPNFVNVTANEAKIDVKVISLALNQYHSIDYLRDNCRTIGTVGSIESLREYYGIQYSLSVPKYRDFMYISNCADYIRRIESEMKELASVGESVSRIAEPQKGSGPNKDQQRQFQVGAGYIGQSGQSMIYKIKWNKIESPNL
jgi:hypothetical protein